MINKINNSIQKTTVGYSIANHMLGGQPCHGKQLGFPLYLHASWSYLRRFDSSNLKSYLEMNWLELGVMSVV